MYAIALGWPADGKVLIKSLAQAGDSKVKKVSLLGSKEKVAWTQTTTGLVVSLPAKQVSRYTCAFKINGAKLAPAPIAAETVYVQPDASGNVTLLADTAETHGSVNTEQRGGQSNLGFWDNPQDYVTWTANGIVPGTYKLSVSSASPNPGTDLLVEVGGKRQAVRVPGTGDWADFKVSDLGTLGITQSGTVEIAIRPADAKTWKPLNLRWVKLTKE